MTKIPRNPISFLWWVSKLMFLWVRTRVASEDFVEQLGLDRSKPVCYVLNHRSFSDIMVLNRVCRKYNLPIPRHRPSALRMAGSAAYIYMQKLGFLKVSRRSGRMPSSPLFTLVQQGESDPGLDVQIVPVSVLWGRNPGKKENSIFKLLFFDDEHAGILQKFFIVLAQGRDCFVNFGKPISLREQVDRGESANETAKKLRRVMRVHFRRQRSAAIGPRLPSREEVAATLVTSGPVKKAIEEEAAKKKVSYEKVEAKAKKYFMEVAAESTYSVVRLFDICLTFIWNRIFRGVRVFHGERARDLSTEYEVVYLPSHRSHMDYLLLAYMLFTMGLYPPHTAAGINLNFWPLGPLLRRGGGFFLRRSFGTDRLYKAVFSEYIHFLVTKGYSLKFYTEGGRSRTGKLLKPATGILAMVVQSFMRDSKRPIVFIPVYLGYDRVLEIGSYLKELRGAKKSKESIGQLIRLPAVLRKDFGMAYLSFGDPIFLEERLNELHPNWRSEAGPDLKPPWLVPFVSGLARDALTRVNSAAVVSPLSVFAMIMLSTPQKAIAEDEMLFMIEKLIDALQNIPYGKNVVISETDPKVVLEEAMKIAEVERFKHPDGDILHLSETESIVLSYYRNNVIHLVAIPSMVAAFLQHNDRVEYDRLVESCAELYALIREEFFLRWSEEESRAVVEKVIDNLVNLQLLVREGGVITRPDITKKEFNCLKVLGRALGNTFERYAISTALLGYYGGKGYVKREDFEKQCQLMARRVAILNGSNDTEFLDKALFRNYIDLMKSMQFVVENEAGELQILEKVNQIARMSLELLSTDIRESVARVVISSENE